MELGAGGGRSGGAGWRHDDAPPLIGRDDEIALLRSFIDRATTRGDAMVLAGDAGVGKTVLLNAAAADAADTGVRTVTVAGSQFEVDVSFAGLQQIVEPFLAYLPRLAELQQTALRSAPRRSAVLPPPAHPLCHRRAVHQRPAPRRPSSPG